MTPNRSKCRIRMFLHLLVFGATAVLNKPVVLVDHMTQQHCGILLVYSGSEFDGMAGPSHTSATPGSRSHVSVSVSLKWALILTAACNFTVSIPFPNKPACKKYLALYLNAYEHRAKRGNGKLECFCMCRCAESPHMKQKTCNIFNVCDSFTLTRHYKILSHQNKYYSYLLVAKNHTWSSHT